MHDYFRLYAIILLQKVVKNPNDYTRLFHYLTEDDYFTLHFTTIISLIFSEHIIVIIAIIVIICIFLLKAIQVIRIVLFEMNYCDYFSMANYVHYAHYFAIFLSKYLFVLVL